MKVIIIGADIGGLSAYLSLKKYLANDKVTIKIYECHGPSTITGVEGSLSLAPNGLRAIASLSSNAIEHLEKNRYTDPFQDPSSRFQGHPWLGRRKRHRFDQMIVRRAVVHEALLLEVPENAIIWYSKLRSVEEDERGVEVIFANGSSDVADLVIGADGIWSVVRECTSGELYAPLREPNLFKFGGDPRWHVYQKREAYRFMKNLKTKDVIMTSGPSGLLLGYSQTIMTPDDDPSVEWWSIYESITPPDQSHSHPLAVRAHPLAVRAHLLSQYALWKPPHDSSDMSPYKEIIKLGCTRQSDLFFIPKEGELRQPLWSSPSGTGRILLLGDAAHVIPYISKQGASSAIEDAIAIGILLHKFREVDGLVIKDALKCMVRAYEDVRMERVQKFLNLTKKDEEKKKHPWLPQKVQNFFVDNLGE
ncbi:hypothetical protein C0993_006804 [Termitomyces sp. T159_Od127]|nr:hypothetical protein C0993_006804 [Termitomyces sp. T159_Od127]